MANQPDFSPEAHLALSLAHLRGLEYAGPALDTQHLVPGVFFSLDPTVANTVHVDSRKGELLTMRFGVERPGRWLSLNLGVGPADLGRCRMVGFACTTDAPVATSFRVCLRSGHEGGHRDAFFPKTVVSGPEAALHLDLMEVASNPAVPRAAPWREFVIFFQCQSHEVSLRDFRFIAI